MLLAISRVGSSYFRASVLNFGSVKHDFLQSYPADGLLVTPDLDIVR